MLVVCDTHGRSHHSEGLPAPRLSVGEHAGIVTLEGAVDHVQAQVWEHLEEDLHLDYLIRALTTLSK